MELNTEQKQRINLSLHAQDVLTIDREQFAPQLTSSGFINELLFRYAPQAEASVTENLERRRKNILMQLETIKMPELNRRAVADALLNPVREELVRKSAAFPRGTSVIFRLNNRNRDLFYDRDWKDAVYYDRRPSKYMKALIEEYASHTAFQREAFYFQEWITLAETAADAGKLLRFTTSNSRNELVIWDMRVYGVFPNEAGLFHYIVGRCVRKGGIKSDERIASFRISRMNEVKILSTASSRSGNLSKAEKKEIEAKIAHDGVQFLVGKRKECVVKLTEEGKVLYRRIQYMKPIPSFIDENGHYHFECSSFQIWQYFYRFGEHAQIVEPAAMREALRDDYYRAYRSYCDGSTCICRCC